MLTTQRRRTSGCWLSSRSTARRSSFLTTSTVTIRITELMAPYGICLPEIQSQFMSGYPCKSSRSHRPGRAAAILPRRIEDSSLETVRQPVCSQTMRHGTPRNRISKAVNASGLSGWKFRASARSPFKRQARARVNPQNGQGLPVSQRKPQREIRGCNGNGKNARSIRMLPEMPTRQRSGSNAPLDDFRSKVVVTDTSSKVFLILKSHQVAIGGRDGSKGKRYGD